MAQPSRKFGNFHSFFDFAIRSSPIVCAASTVDSLLSFVEFYHRDGTLKGSLQDFAAERVAIQPDEEDGGLKVCIEQGFTRLCQNSVFRIGLFVLGALPQVVKIYSIQGVPWTKACCTAYLSTSVVDEMLLAFARYRNDILSTSKADIGTQAKSAARKFLSYGSPLMGSAVGGYCLARLFVEIRPDFEDQSGRNTLLLLPPILVSFAWFALPSKRELLSFIGTSMYFLMGLSLVFYPNIELEYSIMIVAGMWLIDFVDLLIRVDLALGGWVVSTQSSPWKSNFGAAGPYVMWQVLIALYYYVFVYDATTSYRPAWTEWLG